MVLAALTGSAMLTTVSVVVAVGCSPSEAITTGLATPTMAVE